MTKYDINGESKIDVSQISNFYEVILMDAFDRSARDSFRKLINRLQMDDLEIMLQSIIQGEDFCSLIPDGSDDKFL